jgi:hypothetical protein
VTVIVGVLGAALLFGVFSMLRQNDKGCTGQCIGCTRDGACESKSAGTRREDPRSVE